MKKFAFVAFMDFIGFDFLRGSATFKFAFLQIAIVRAMLKNVRSETGEARTSLSAQETLEEHKNVEKLKRNKNNSL